MTAQNQTFEESIAAVDGLPNPRNEVNAPPLSLVKLREVAIHAAQQGFCEVELGFPERAAGAVARAAEVLIVSRSDISLDGWVRRGAREGIMSAWACSPSPPRSPSGSLAIQQLHTLAFTGAAGIVRSVITAEHARREKEQARS